MIKLITGVPGTGKTKTLISMVNEAVKTSKGNVVCIEKGIKLRFDIDYNARLINADKCFGFACSGNTGNKFDHIVPPILYLC